MNDKSNQLALAGGSAAPAKRISELCSKRMWALATDVLEDPDDRRARIQAIATSPALRQEAMVVLDALGDIIGRPSDEALYGALQPLAVVKRMPDFGKGEAAKGLTKAWWAIHIGQLKQFPLAAVREGVKDVLATHRYPDFPQPAEIVKACEPHAIKLRTAHYRMKSALAIEFSPEKEISRAANRKAMIEAGFMTPDGELNVKALMGRRRPQPDYRRPAESQAAMAARIRASASAG